MEYIVRYLNNNDDFMRCKTITEIINYFKNEKKYKFPNFLREELKRGNSVRFSINRDNYYIRIE